MSLHRHSLSIGVSLIAFVSMFSPTANAGQDAAGSSPVRGLAIIDLGFEEPAGDATDQAKQGASADVGKAVNDPQRIPSPFWGQESRKAILLDAARQQTVQIPDGPDVDRPSAVSASLFFLNLHPLNDEAFHGMFAKRAEQAGQNVTNFGINYRATGDALQLYINDGSGFRTVVYSVKEVINTRRRTHLTATWEAGDAPGTDADTDADDVRVKLFLNGQPVTPQSVSTGQIVGHDGWMQDIAIPKLLNDVPVTLGSSTLTT